MSDGIADAFKESVDKINQLEENEQRKLEIKRGFIAIELEEGKLLIQPLVQGSSISTKDLFELSSKIYDESILQLSQEQIINQIAMKILK